MPKPRINGVLTVSKKLQKRINRLKAEQEAEEALNPKKRKRIKNAWTPARIREVRNLLIKYTKETEIPIFSEFCSINDLPRPKLYELPELQPYIQALITKKEGQLERQCLDGRVDKAMAIFSLKQLGWKDKQEVEHSGGVKIVKDDIV